MVHTIGSSVPLSSHPTSSADTIDRKVDGVFQSFMQEALKESGKTMSSVTFSQHAKKRLDEQGFSLNETDLHLLEEAVETLEAKGSKNSLILYDELALIASIKNKTVITALKSTEMTEVTNIDSAIQINNKR